MPRTFSEVTVSLDVGSRGRYLELRLTDPKLIRELVEDPLQRAKQDTNPAKYVVLGSIRMVDVDGNEERLALFYPWGRCKRADTYLIADFSVLQRELKKAMEYVIPKLDTAKDEAK